MVYNLCINYLNNIEEAEEATQDIFVKIHQKLAQFKEQSSPKTWIYRIAINHCLDVIKSKKRQKRFAFFQSLFSEDKNEELFQSPFLHPGAALEDQESTAAIFDKINELPDNQKTALILKTLDNLSMKEIADVMETSEKSVESLLSRARKNLKEKLNADEG